MKLLLPRIIFIVPLLLLASPSGFLHPSERAVHLPEGTSLLAPVWSDAYFLRWDLYSGVSEIFDRQGGKVQEVLINPPSGRLVRLNRITSFRSTNFAAIGSAESQSGKSISFLALWRLGAQEIQYVPLPYFGPLSVTYAADGTLWLLCRSFDEQFRESKNYDILRHYSADGVFLGSALPRTVFMPGDTATVTNGYLVAGKDRLGAFLAKAGVWIEFDNTGKILGHWKFGDKLKDSMVISVAMVSNGDAYIHLQTNQSKPKKNQIMVRIRAGSGAWEILSPDLGGELDQRIYLYGADGDQLVVGSARDKNRMEWATPLP